MDEGILICLKQFFFAAQSEMYFCCDTHTTAESPAPSSVRFTSEGGLIQSLLPLQCLHNNSGKMCSLNVTKLSPFIRATAYQVKSQGGGV